MIDQAAAELRRLQAQAAKATELQLSTQARMNELRQGLEQPEDHAAALRQVELDRRLGDISEKEAAKQTAKILADQAAQETRGQPVAAELAKLETLLADIDLRLDDLQGPLQAAHEAVLTAMGDHLKAEILSTSDELFECVQTMRGIYRRLYGLNGALHQVAGWMYDESTSRDKLTGLWIGKAGEIARNSDGSFIFDGMLERAAINDHAQSVLTELSTKYPEAFV